MLCLLGPAFSRYEILETESTICICAIGQTENFVLIVSYFCFLDIQVSVLLQRVRGFSPLLDKFNLKCPALLK
jgi:hypothetical protein